MLRQTFGLRLDDPCRRCQSFAQPKRLRIDQRCRQAYRNHQERHCSTGEDTLCDARSLLPELLVRRRAILSAKGLRSSSCYCWNPRKRATQSHAWHNVAGLCLVHFPRFRKTQTSRCDMQSHPQFTSWNNRGTASRILAPHEKLRLTPSKTRIPIGLAGERQIPNCGQMAQKSSQTAKQQDQTDYVRDV